jgi:alkanesulfonate monooxygenase SsuD/methylene tetrahydromethanopterin reductase-like flavin-dependent oxidoreductase (luciferase family)
MKIWHFSEMSYPYLPPQDEYDSIRVTLPSRHFDPEKGADLYNRLLDEWMFADELGLNLMINEHHQTPTCINPAAPIIVGILARTTKKARILILGNPIANRNQPIRVAEEMAMVDVISRGRLECGFVRSVPYEIAAANSNPVRMNERMWEAHDFILKAWTTHDGPFSFEGRFFHHRMVNIWPRPYQQPHPPVWVSSTSVPGARKVGEHGYVLAVFMTGFAQTPAVFQSYRDAWQSTRNTETTPLDRLAYSALVYTGETDEEGRAGAEKLLWYFTHNKIPPYFRNPPGYLPVSANVRVMRGGASSLRPGSRTVDSLIEQGLLFCGSPDTVFNQIRRFYEHVGGFGHLLSMGQAGFLDHSETKKGLRLLAREVMPRLAALRPTQSAAA